MTHASSDISHETAAGDGAETLADLIARLRRSLPRPGMPHKTFEELSAEQGTGPIDIERLMAKSPGPLYEGFEEDVRRMRSGQLPLGPPPFPEGQLHG